MVLLILSKTRDLIRHQICEIRSTTFKHLCFYSLSIKYAKNNYVMGKSKIIDWVRATK